MGLWKYIKEHMQNHLTQTVSERNSSLCYEELIIYTEAFAKKLDGEECCAIYCKSELAAVIILLGCFAAGITAVPLSPRYDTVYIKRVIDFTHPTCTITDTDGKFSICHISGSEYEANDNAPSLVICTDTAEGGMKKVILSEESIIANIHNKSDYTRSTRPLYQVTELLRAITNGEKIDFYSGT